MFFETFQMPPKESLKAKQEKYEKAMDSKDIERLVPEIEMLKVVLFLVSRNERKEERVGVVCN